MIHRDLKPSNILVGELGETVVIDWGLAKVVGEPDDDAAPVAPAPSLAGDSLHTRIGTVFGTPGFMPPEQALAREVDARSEGRRGPGPATGPGRAGRTDRWP